MEYLSSKAKQLNETVGKLTRQVHNLNQSKTTLVTQIVATHRELTAAKKELSDYSKGGPITITDHALTRYLERVLGLDMEEFGNQILTPQRRKLINDWGDGVYKFNEDEVILVRNHKVITVYTNEEEYRKKYGKNEKLRTLDT